MAHINNSVLLYAICRFCFVLQLKAVHNQEMYSLLTIKVQYNPAATGLKRLQFGCKYMAAIVRLSGWGVAGKSLLMWIGSLLTQVERNVVMLNTGG